MDVIPARDIGRHAEEIELALGGDLRAAHLRATLSAADPCAASSGTRSVGFFPAKGAQLQHMSFDCPLPPAQINSRPPSPTCRPHAALQECHRRFTDSCVAKRATA